MLLLLPNHPSPQIIATYCERKAITKDSVRFIGPEGNHIVGDRTVAESGLEDDDVIDVSQVQAREAA